MRSLLLVLLVAFSVQDEARISKLIE